jgi:hypothetical protein
LIPYTLNTQHKGVRKQTLDNNKGSHINSNQDTCRILPANCKPFSKADAIKYIILMKKETIAMINESA